MASDKQQIKKIRNSLTRQVQVGKVNVSKQILFGLQGRGGDDRWPPLDQYLSYVTSTSAKNRYKDINRFWDIMEKAPKYWDKKFIYIASADENESIIKAAIDAIDISDRQYQKYPQGESTGRLRRAQQYYVNGVRSKRPLSDIEDSDGAALFQIVSTAPYGSTAEARSYHLSRQGLLFYTAKRIQRLYPDIGVVFRYGKGLDYKSDDFPSHIYDVPILSIGPKSLVAGSWSTPGVRDRRRLKAKRRILAALEN